MNKSGPHIEARPSEIEGIGLFALRNFELNELIHRVEFDREVTDRSPLRPELGERVEHCAYPEGKIMLVAFPYRHMNHSCDPNAYYTYDGATPIAWARRAIPAGTEITVDYLINNPGGSSWPCQCGVARCRGETGTSFFELPVHFQREYVPLLAPWFRKRFAHRLLKLEIALANSGTESAT